VAYQNSHTYICACVCQKRSVKLDFIPETYRLDDPKEREKFTEVFQGVIILCFT